MKLGLVIAADTEVPLQRAARPLLQPAYVLVQSLCHRGLQVKVLAEARQLDGSDVLELAQSRRHQVICHRHCVRRRQVEEALHDQHEVIELAFKLKLLLVGEDVVEQADIVRGRVFELAYRAGADELWRIGGAQAVAALAYGTQSIKPVDKITGPGNAYVAAAKRRVFGQVGIDLIAGPSEILVVADGQNDPAWIAADLLSQAEHDASSQSVLVTDDAAFADAVVRAVEAELKVLPRAEIARASWRDNGAIILVPDIADCSPIVDAIAAEHVELALEAAPAGALAENIRHAGAIFLGRHTPEAIGDYVAGTNHVLPTSRAARFSGGLGVADFLKRTSLVACTPESLAALGPSALALAEAEGLGAHGRSVSIRLNRR